eukprot:CAMPEP_0168521012 /NCGR_PEP_ID=MMETSP0405-20121227/8398_1 /TAXON_ID=498012 /ORGANISM="Trichosphaerium sp, Strain Am-I-7 wt" /LENGTH=41 /DNA_ID= /DNA_START= /DNA_END= /DNA_ORIENTATION=
MTPSTISMASDLQSRSKKEEKRKNGVIDEVQIGTRIPERRG